MKARLKALAGRVWPFALTALLALGIGYWSGSRALPARLEERSRVEERTETSKVTYKRVNERSTTDKKTEKTRTKVTKTVKYRKDGTKSSETTTEIGDITKKTEVGTEDRQSDTKKDEKTVAERTETREKVVEYRRSDWRVTALVGAQLQNPLQNAGNPFSPNLFVGLNAERRIIGPFWGGVFVAGSFPVAPLGAPKAMYAGVSISLEF